MSDNGKLTWTNEPITWTNTKRKLSDLIPWERNPRQTKRDQARRLVESLEQFGQIHPIAITPDNMIIDGHQREKVWSAADKYGPDLEVDVRVASRALTEKEREKLTIFLHKGAAGEFDFDILANEFEVGDLLDWGFDEKELGLDGFSIPEDEEAEPEVTISDVPDAVWPSNNDWGVPLLDINLQADALDLPFECWGSFGRKSQMKGTWHFYTEDYRFEALWHDPSPILNSGAINVVEPNFSCYEQMPPAVALWQIYRKRWMARWWQSFGLQVFVDLNVAEPHYQLNLLGIPGGWKAWATRGYNDRLDGTEKEYQMAIERAGTESILFVVYGGGKRVKEMCQSNGWLWLDEQENSKGKRDG